MLLRPAQPAADPTGGRTLCHAFQAEVPGDGTFHRRCRGPGHAFLHGFPGDALAQSFAEAVAHDLADACRSRSAEDSADRAGFHRVQGHSRVEFRAGSFGHLEELDSRVHRHVGRDLGRHREHHLFQQALADLLPEALHQVSEDRHDHLARGHLRWNHPGQRAAEGRERCRCQCDDLDQQRCQCRPDRQLRVLDLHPTVTAGFRQRLRAFFQLLERRFVAADKFLPVFIELLRGFAFHAAAGFFDRTVRRFHRRVDVSRRRLPDFGEADHRVFVAFRPLSAEHPWRDVLDELRWVHDRHRFRPACC
ncbi:hypothetical protein LWC34_23245 [Kibdelosporangium philippinense]|uniref:Uncharacterized protein n=1 Tax=Kibdelosporangium philippinense TaxID=211113 RepID=A0ABS8ZCZ3_9PSEU|nr:hypothetical protein [Kibdelosporangium philippinense]